MTRILMDPAAVTDLERQVRRESERLYQIVGGLERALTGLDWESDVGLLLKRESGRVLGESRLLVQGLLTLAERLRHSRERMLEADWYGYTKLERFTESQPDWVKITGYVGRRILGITSPFIMPVVNLPFLNPVRPKVADSRLLNQIDTALNYIARPHTLLAVGGAMLLDRYAPAEGGRTVFGYNGSKAGLQVGSVQRQGDGSVKVTVASGYVGPKTNRTTLSVATGQATFNPAGKVSLSGAVAEVNTYQTVLRMGPPAAATVEAGTDRHLRFVGGSVLLDDEGRGDGGITLSAEAYVGQLDAAAVVRAFDLEARLGVKGCVYCIGTPGYIAKDGLQGEFGRDFGQFGGTVYWDVGDAVKFIQNWKVPQGTR